MNLPHFGISKITSLEKLWRSEAVVHTHNGDGKSSLAGALSSSYYSYGGNLKSRNQNQNFLRFFLKIFE